MQRLAGERIKYAVSNDKSKNAGYMGVSHYILRFVYSFLYILLLDDAPIGNANTPLPSAN